MVCIAVSAYYLWFCFFDVYVVFETLQKLYSKAKTVVEQQGGGPPKFYVIALVELEDFVQKVLHNGDLLLPCSVILLVLLIFKLWEDKEVKQKLSKLNAKVCPVQSVPYQDDICTTV